ncbi:MAG: DMT family transporter [Candidatus Acidulodesulfobacterium acidiphilum]|jgi:drug/metabolite transporter (DMT)-like permease|uniref:DMT family transporter n=1 Tax=Candidatus Acidulodesulfobacterium acidiphilum TaxID=2597224 RepID=A0A520XD93_9DELT|nr:MAG: DMT family transporter [Candidatus Acidulodesulfobacterium acidiphilum]
MNKSNKLNYIWIALLTFFTIFGFAVNSLLARVALQNNIISPLCYSLLRLGSGALILFLIISYKKIKLPKPNYLSAFALFIYAFCFSIGYIEVSVAVGALLVFSAVQFTIIGDAILIHKEKLFLFQWLGVLLSMGGFVLLVYKGLSVPKNFIGYFGAVMMIISGIGWGIYTLKGKFEKQYLLRTASNFIYSLIYFIPLIIIFAFFKNEFVDGQYINAPYIYLKPIILGVLSGAIFSALFYMLWYKVVTKLSRVLSSSVQLLTPAIAAVLGIIFLNEKISLNFFISAILILGGIIFVILKEKKAEVKEETIEDLEETFDK